MMMRYLAFLVLLVLELSTILPSTAAQTCGSQSSIFTVTDNYIYVNPTLTGTINALKLSIQSSNDAHIGLGSTNDFSNPSSQKPFYEIVIGGWSNTKTAIRKVSAGPVMASLDRSSGYLSSSEYRDFWITWSVTGTRVIRIGTGTIIGSNEITSWTDTTNVYDIKYFAIAEWGSQGRQGNFKITQCTLNAPTTSAPTKPPTTLPPVTTKPPTTPPSSCGAQSSVITVNDNYVYAGVTSIDTVNALKFSIQSSGDAHIGLGSTNDFSNPLDRKSFYEILIGGWSNTKTGIRKISSADLKSELDRPSGYLSSTEYRDFWITWNKNGVIRIGTGTTIGSNQLISWTDNQGVYDIKYAAIAQWGSQGRQGQWKITSCTYTEPPTTAPPTIAPAIWNPPAKYVTPLAQVWTRVDTKYSDGRGVLFFKNYISDQIIAGNGNINYCVRWESTATVSTTLRDRIHANLARTFNQWITVMQDSATGTGWYGFPYKNVNVKVVGWAVRNRSQLQWTDNSVDVYVNDINEGAPQCAPACGRFFHQDGNYGACPGGASHHYDMSLWLTSNMFGGAGGDWGQRIGSEYMVNALDSSDIHILQHEMGHSWGLDDFYDWDPTPGEGFVMKAGSAARITEFDIWMLRDMWRHIKVSGRYTAAGIKKLEIDSDTQQPGLNYQHEQFGDQQQETGDSNNTTTYIIIGSVIGSITIITVAIAIIMYKRKKHQTTVTHMTTPTLTSDPMV